MHIHSSMLLQCFCYAFAMLSQSMRDAFLALAAAFFGAAASSSSQVLRLKLALKPPLSATGILRLQRIRLPDHCCLLLLAGWSRLGSPLPEFT